MTDTHNQTFQEMHHKDLWRHSNVNQIRKCSTQVLFYSSTIKVAVVYNQELKKAIRMEMTKDNNR